MKSRWHKESDGTLRMLMRPGWGARVIGIIPFCLGLWFYFEFLGVSWRSVMARKPLLSLPGFSMLIVMGTILFLVGVLFLFTRRMIRVKKGEAIVQDSHLLFAREVRYKRDQMEAVRAGVPEGSSRYGVELILRDDTRVSLAEDTPPREAKEIAETCANLLELPVKIDAFKE